MGYGLRYEYGIFRQTIQDGWQQRAARQLAAAARSLGSRRGRRKRSKSSSTARSRCRAAACVPVSGRPSSLLGIPFDRPIVGYGGKTINTLRLWAAATPDYFDFQVFSHGDFVSALAEQLAAESRDPRSLSRRLDQHGSGAALRAGIFPRRLLAGRPHPPLPPRQRRLAARCPTRSPSSSTTRIRPSRSPN